MSSVLQDLVSINPAKAAELVAGHFLSEVEPIITALQVSDSHSVSSSKMPP